MPSHSPSTRTLLIHSGYKPTNTISVGVLNNCFFPNILTLIFRYHLFHCWAESSASFSDQNLSVVNFHISIFFSRATGLISINLDEWDSSFIMWDYNNIAKINWWCLNLCQVQNMLGGQVYMEGHIPTKYNDFNYWTIIFLALKVFLLYMQLSMNQGACLMEVLHSLLWNCC